MCFQCVSHHDAALTLIFSGCGNDHSVRLQGLVSAKLAHEALYGFIAAPESALGH